VNTLTEILVDLAVVAFFALMGAGVNQLTTEKACPDAIHAAQVKSDQ